MNLAAIIDPHPDDVVALVSRGKSTTYATLRDQVGRLRGGLHRLGVEPGDRVAIICANNWYFVVSYLATLGVGAVAVPLNPSSPAPELESELRHVESKVAIVGPGGKNSFAGVDRAKVPSLQHVVATQGDELAGADVLDELMEGDGFGLSGMRDRVGLVGGTLVVRDGATAGTTLTVRIPLRVRQESA